MSAPAFTPGPWSVATCSEGAECWCRIISIAGREDSEDLKDCVIHAGAVNKRDANLIATAPELYEALTGAIALLDDCEIAHPMKWDNALAHARGECR